MNREYHQDIEYNQQGQDAVKYSAEWMKPANHVYRRRKLSIWQRLIRWIAGFAYGN